MSSTSDAKLTYALLGLYENLYAEKYGSKPKYNKFREKWAMQDIIDSVGFDRAKELIEYYFKVTKPRHPLQWFFYNFDKLDEMLNQSELDKIKRNKIREQTKRMVEEDEHRSSSN
jgi:hypothetical protein